MVERNPLGRVRLRCDALDCERLFVPRSPLTDIRETRLRAELFGWACPRVGDRVVVDPEEMDFCPDHTRARAPAGGGG